MFGIPQVHPLIVHAPLILLPVAVLFSVLALLFPRHGFRVAAILLLLGGVIGAVIATETGETAEHQAERASEEVEDITVAGTIPQVVADGKLLETHAQLGENTRNLYGLLLIVEAGLFAASTPALAKWRGSWSLSQRVDRIARGVWVIVAAAGIALVVLTGHYGGTLVYAHGVGVTQQGAAQPGTSVTTPPTNQAGGDADD